MNHPHTIDHRYAPKEQWTAICHPDDSHKTLVGDDGALLYNYYWQTGFKHTFSFDIESQRGVLKITQRTESAEFPCVETRLEYSQAFVTLRTFAVKDRAGLRTDVVLWTIEVKPGVRDFKARLKLKAECRNESLVLDPNGCRIIVESNRREAAGSQADVQQTLVLFFPGKMVPAKTPFGGVFQPGWMTEGKLLQGGETVGGVCILPHGHDSLDDFSHEWALQALDREKAFWKKWSQDHVALSIPDPTVQEMIVACARNQRRVAGISGWGRSLSRIMGGRWIFYSGSGAFHRLREGCADGLACAATACQT
jgi:hypothetical protein